MFCERKKTNKNTKKTVLPDESLQAGTCYCLRDVREELQAELTQEVVLLLQGQKYKVRTHTVGGTNMVNKHMQTQ